MNNIPIAEEVLMQACRDAGFTDNYSRMVFRIMPDSSSAYVEAIINHTKLHVEAALKAAAENAWLVDGCDTHGVEIDEKTILNAYPLTNIK